MIAVYTLTGYSPNWIQTDTRKTRDLRRSKHTEFKNTEFCTSLSLKEVTLGQIIARATFCNR